jgi:SNF2 family DNA or RNA helicase
MQLHSYQNKAVDFILDKKKCALYLDMGLGKTVIALTAAQNLLDDFTINKVLVIAPLRVANNVWHNEIKHWQHLKHLTYSIVTGNEKQRFKALEKRVDIYIINRENLLWLFMNGYRDFGMIIVDESTSFKNPSRVAAKLFKSVKVYRKVKQHFNNCTFTQFSKYKINKFVALSLMKCDYMVQLTGTPSPNGLMDIYSQIYCLDKGERLGKTLTEYRETYFTKDRYGFGYECDDSEGIYDKIKDITMSMTATDYIELPKKINLVTNINLGEHKEKYDELAKEFILKVSSGDIIAANAGVLTNKLLQFCNGAIYDEFKDYSIIHDFKLDALEEIIEGNPNESIIVAYNYKSDLERLKNRFKQAVIMSKDSREIEAWNQGDIKLLLCHPASSGKGLNLQHGGRIIVWFGLTWNLEDYLQFNARLYRQGQIKPVIINHIVAKDCIDELVLERLGAKNNNQKELLEALIETMRSQYG